MDVTAKLLDGVGFDDLTTILIAKELNISVGALYHYYPNKHAILRALAERWLAAWNIILDDIEALPVERMSIERLVSEMSALFASVYEDQKAVLPLARAMSVVPEIRDLDLKHDALVVTCLARVFKRMGIGKSNNDRQRIGNIYLETVHAIMILHLKATGVGSKRILESVNAMSRALLYRHLKQA
ncbi:MAG: AcrR family transcriptional regulator [Arenicella sp.]|jgi:AcrR family transcriptional regulator